MTMSSYSRKQWGARNRDGFGSRALPATGLYLHHSVTASPGPDATWKEDVAAVRTLENIGQARFGGGISYNRVICESGRTFVGVSDDRIGAHTAKHNTRGLGIVFIGNYDKRTPGTKQVDALVALMVRLEEADHVALGTTMLGHSDVKATACPGAKLYAMLDSINDRAQRRYRIVKPSARIRVKASTRSATVRIVSKGAVLRILPGSTLLWIHVSYKGEAGYVKRTSARKVRP